MNESIQQMLDQAQRYMENAHQVMYSGSAGTRVLQALVTMLARDFLTKEQQQQVETILDLHENCLAHNGQPKPISQPRTQEEPLA